MTPVRRRFSYRVFQLLLDPDRLDEMSRDLTIFSHNRFNLLSYFDRDHGDRSGRPLRAWAEATFAQAGIALEGGALRLLCFPRVLGYVFNPVSLVFGYGPDGALRGVIYEVNNTFGETHAYVAPAGDGPLHGQEAAKVFHVSPFLDIHGDYRFAVTAPGERLFVSVANLVDGGVEHYASLRGVWRKLSNFSLLNAFISHPLMTLKVIGMIHWEALKIVSRGIRYRSRPPLPAAPVSIGAALSLHVPQAEPSSAGALAPLQPLSNRIDGLAR